MVDQMAANRDRQHLRIFVRRTVRVLRVEGLIASDVEGLALDLVDLVAVLVEGSHDGSATGEATRQVVDTLAEHRTATCQQANDDQCKSNEASALLTTAEPGQVHLDPLPGMC